MPSWRVRLRSCTETQTRKTVWATRRDTSANTPAAVALLLSEQSLGQALQRGSQGVFDGLYSLLCWVTILYATKLAVIVGYTPIFALCLLVALVDGLVARYVRKACYGNESASIYHRAKLLGLGYLPAVVGIVFLASPVDYHPGWILVPAGFVSALMLRTQAKFYKKYL